MRVQAAGIAWDICEPTVGSESLMRISIYLGERRVFVPNSAFVAAGSPSAARALYSRETKSVAIMPSNDGDPLAAAVSERPSKSHGRYMSCAKLCRSLRSDGYSGTIHVPVQWHPDGLLWGDLTMATKLQRKTAKAKGVAG